MQESLFALGFKENVISKFLQNNPEFSLESPNAEQVYKVAKKLVRQGSIERRKKRVESYQDIDSLFDDLIDTGFRQEFVAEKMGHIEFSECLAHRGSMHISLDLVEGEMTELFPLW
ncbi:hypothetical protein C8_189 [Cannes 8 virus]|nr:hypothetical protein C8_189 [Cannes 8 virus]